MEDREDPCERPLKLLGKVVRDDELRREVLKRLGDANETFGTSVHEYSSEGGSDLSENFDDGPEDIGQTLNKGCASSKIFPHLEEPISSIGARLNYPTKPITNRGEKD